MPWQIWASLVAFVLVMLAGIVRFVFPPELPDYPPLLGVVDRPRPTPPPRH